MHAPTSHNKTCRFLEKGVTFEYGIARSYSSVLPLLYRSKIVGSTSIVLRRLGPGWGPFELEYVDVMAN